MIALQWMWHGIPELNARMVPLDQIDGHAPASIAVCEGFGSSYPMVIS